MKKWYKHICIMLITLLCAFSLTGCVSNKSTNKTVNLCEVTHSIFYAPQYVAINKGFFSDEGIDINLTNGGGSDKVMAAVLSDNMDIGLSGPETCIYVYNEGKDDSPKVFAQLTKRDGSFLLARENINNFKWDKLKGKTVIPGRKGGVPYMVLEYILKQNNINPSKDVTLDDSIQFDLMASAFTNGTADFVTAFEPTASQIEKSGRGFVVASLGTASGEIPYTGYIAKQSYINNNKDTIQGFTNAIAKAQKWVNEHSAQEIAEAIASHFPDTDAESLTLSIQNYKDIDVWNLTPEMKEDNFNRLQDVIISAGELGAKVPFEHVVTNEFAQNVN